MSNELQVIERHSLVRQKATAVRTEHINDHALDASNRYLETKLSVRKDFALERMIRCFVKAAGGFRKGLHIHDKNHARALLEMAGRKEPVWDHSITLPRD